MEHLRPAYASEATPDYTHYRVRMASVAAPRGAGYESVAIHPKAPPASDSLYAMPYLMDESGAKGALLVNKKAAPMLVSMKGVAGGSATVIEVAPGDDETALNPPIERQIGSDGSLLLGPFATAVVTSLVHTAWPGRNRKPSP